MKLKHCIAIQAASLLLPWKLRRMILNKLLGFEIHKSARIKLSIINTKKLVMKEGCIIGSLTFIKGLELVSMERHSVIGNLNWITGFPLGSSLPFFKSQENRVPSLHLGEHSAITNRHLLDCTDKVSIGKFTTFAGFGSQILTHSINIYTSRQESAPVTIGDYCFIGTRSIFLPGSSIPANSVLGAGSIVNKSLLQEWSLYGGTPAKLVKAIPKEAMYFNRNEGRVY